MPIGEEKYTAVSLARVFDVDVIQDDEREAQLLAQIPVDDDFHEAPPVCVEYKSPRLYIRVAGDPPGSEKEPGSHVLPIAAIVFFVKFNRPDIAADIDKCHQYVDGVTNRGIAELIHASWELADELYHFCLFRCNAGGDAPPWGGGIFR